MSDGWNNFFRPVSPNCFLAHNVKLALSNIDWKILSNWLRPTKPLIMQRHWIVACSNGNDHFSLWISMIPNSCVFYTSVMIKIPLRLKFYNRSHYAIKSFSNWLKNRDIVPWDDCSFFIFKISQLALLCKAYISSSMLIKEFLPSCIKIFSIPFEASELLMQIFYSLLILSQQIVQALFNNQNISRRTF